MTDFERAFNLYIILSGTMFNILVLCFAYKWFYKAIERVFDRIEA